MSTARLQAYAQHLYGIDVTPQPPIALPGQEFDPPTSGVWIECKLFPNEPDAPYWNGDSPELLRGFFQVTVNIRPLPGDAGFAAMISAYNVVEDVIELFSRGTKVHDTTVLKVWQSPELEEDNRISIPITVRYTGMVGNC